MADGGLLRNVRLWGFLTTAARDAFGTRKGVRVGDHAVLQGSSTFAGGMYRCTAAGLDSSTWVAAVGSGGLTAGQFPTSPGIVTPAMLDNGTAQSVLGVSGNASAVRTNIASGGARRALMSNSAGTAIAFRALETADLPSLDTALDSDATRWVTIQDIDMAAWASTDFTSGGDGTVSVGGLTWNKANVAAANGAPGYFRRNVADVGDDSGAGVRVLHDASLSTTLTTSTDSAPTLWMLLSALDTAYDETAEYVVQLHVTRLTETGTITNSQPTRLAMLLHAPAGSPTGTPVRVAGVAYRRSGAGVWIPCIETSGTTDTSRTDVSYSGSPGGYNVLSLHFGPKGIQGYTGIYDGGWPTFASLTGLGFRASAQSNPNWVDVYNHRSTRLSIVAASGVSNTGSIDVMYRRIRLLRRRVA